MRYSINDCISELKTAIAHDEGAKAEALQRGLEATQPLSLERLGELCALGEHMAQTSARRRQAVTDLRRALSLAAIPERGR